MSNGDARLDALLVWPPYEATSVYRPYSAPYWLVDHLRHNGLRAEVLDVSRAALSALSTDVELLSAELERRERERAELDGRKRLSRLKTMDYYDVVADIGALRKILANQERIRRPENKKTLKLDGEVRYSDLLQRIAESVLLARDYEQVCDSAHSMRSMQKLMASEKVANFRRLTAPCVAEAAARHRPRLVGISVPFSLHLLPAVIIAAEFKKHDPSVHICLGGPVISLLHDDELRNTMRLASASTVIKHDGEKPLLDLVRAVKRGDNDYNIDRLYTRQALERGETAQDPTADAASQAAADALVERMRAKQRLQLLRGGAIASNPGDGNGANGGDANADAPAQQDVSPRFRYPEETLAKLPRDTTLMILESRGCYWGECTFCDFINIYGENRYTPRKLHNVIEDFEYYASLGFKRFWLVTDSLPPRPAREISRGLIERGIDVEWQTFVKVDRRWDVETLRLMRQSGFESAIVGMEAAHPRLLQILRKGYDDTEAHEFMRKAREADFTRMYINVITDPPTATYEESMAAVKFCAQYRDRIQACRPGSFVLTATSEIGLNPDEFNIEIIGDTNKRNRVNRLTSLRYRAKDGSGMTPAEKRDVEARLRTLDSEIFKEWCYAGLGIEVLRARSAAELVGWKFQLLSDMEFTTERVPYNPSGWKSKTGGIWAIRHLSRPEELRSTGLVQTTGPLCAIANAQAGNEVTLESLGAYLEEQYDMEGSGADVALMLIKSLINMVFIRRITASDGRVGSPARKLLDVDPHRKPRSRSQSAPPAERRPAASVASSSSGS